MSVRIPEELLSRSPMVHALLTMDGAILAREAVYDRLRVEFAKPDADREIINCAVEAYTALLAVTSEHQPD